MHNSPPRPGTVHPPPAHLNHDLRQLHSDNRNRSSSRSSSDADRQLNDDRPSSRRFSLDPASTPRARPPRREHSSLINEDSNICRTPLQDLPRTTPGSQKKKWENEKSFQNMITRNGVEGDMSALVRALRRISQTPGVAGKFAVLEALVHHGGGGGIGEALELAFRREGVRAEVEGSTVPLTVQIKFVKPPRDAGGIAPPRWNSDARLAAAVEFRFKQTRAGGADDEIQQSSGATTTFKAEATASHNTATAGRVPTQQRQRGNDDDDDAPLLRDGGDDDVPWQNGILVVNYAAWITDMLAWCNGNGTRRQGVCVWAGGSCGQEWPALCAHCGRGSRKDKGYHGEFSETGGLCCRHKNPLLAQKYAMSTSYGSDVNEL